MAQLVSAKFTNAQDSPANLPVAKVQLVLGNYASAAAFGATTLSSGDDASGNYPASGAIDGDRTELNVGPASGADNSVGKSSWRSSTIPNHSQATWLEIDFNATRIVNRVKIYGLSSSLLKGVTVSYWNGASWTALGTAQQPNPVKPVGLFTFDFPDTTTTRIRLDVVNTVNASDPANIVEVEVYRVLDITSRIKGIKVSRQRDYKLANPMAAQVQLDCINTDRFFSISHVPTATEVAAGFVNSELRPNAQIVVYFGFNLYGASTELVPAIVAYLDAITPKPKTRDCRITGRDGMKGLINQTDSSNLKTNIELSNAILYVLNRGNISVWETSLGVTNIIIPYFFTDQEDHLTTIRELTQAAGDSLFYFNESGVAVFQFYTGNLPLSFTYPVQADWSTGTFTVNMEKNGSDQLQLNVQFSTPASFVNTGAVNPNVAAGLDQGNVRSVAQSFQLPYATVLTNVTFTISYFKAVGSDNATFNVWADNGGRPGTSLYSTTISTATGGPFALTVNVSPSLSLAGGKYWYGLVMSSDPTNGDSIERATVNFSEPAQTAPVQIAPYGNTLCQETNKTVWQVLGAGSSINNLSPVANLGIYTFKTASGSGTWTGPTLDLGVGLTSMQPLLITAISNGNTTQYFTQSSPDGVHWSGFVATAANGQPQSPLNRYFQVRVSMVQSQFSGTSDIVLDVEVNWTGGLGTRKYPAAPSSFTFSYDSNLIDVSQELADNLGGDTSILNDVTVQASPILLQGTNNDVVWQGTIGTPPVNISPSAPMTVAPGQAIVISPYISGGMDTSGMSLHSPTALAVTFANGAAGLTFCTFTSPTLPVFEINITTGGTITNLQVIGKTFTTSAVVQAAQTKDAASIQQFGDRKQSVQNRWIVTTQIAQVIANNIVSVFKTPFSYIPSFATQPTFSMQIGDRVTVKDVNLDLSADFIAVGIDQEFKVSGDKGSVQTTGKLLAIPVGL